MMTEMGVPRLTVSCVLNHAEGGTTWKYDRGMLQLAEILDVQDTDEPLPDVRIPLRKEDRPNATDGKLIAPGELENMVNKGGWTSQALGRPAGVTGSPA